MPLHLLYTIDTLDPLFPFRIEGIRFLPIFYCLSYNSASMSYLPHSDGTVEVSWIEHVDCFDDFPYDNYPESFRQCNVALLPLSEDEAMRLEVAKSEWSAFELDRDRDHLYNIEQGIEDLGTRFGGWHFLCQGPPRPKCKNPKCPDGLTQVFGVIYNAPVNGVRLWDPDDDWSDSQTIFHVCSSCRTIHVFNSCT